MKKTFLLLFVGYWLFGPCFVLAVGGNESEQSGGSLSGQAITGYTTCYCSSEKEKIDFKNYALLGNETLSQACNRKAEGLKKEKNDLTWYCEIEQIQTTKIFDDIKLQAPTLKVRIPGFDKFSEPPTVMNESGIAYFPWLGEYIRAIYNFGLTAISILAVLMIIVSGIKIIFSGLGGDRKEAYKRITQSIIGLLLAWGSYTILFIINPNLLNLKSLGVKLIEPIALETYDKETAPTPISPKALNCAMYDNIFKTYANCTNVDWRVLKAIAYVESSLDATVVNSIGFTGLFQTKTKYANSYVQKFGITYGDPANFGESKKPPVPNPALQNPEKNTQVGAAIVRDSESLIRQSCPNIENESKHYFLYVGHQSGTGVLKIALQKSCDYKNAKQSIQDYYTAHPTNRSASEIANEADSGAKRLLSAIAELGVTSAGKMDDANCPLKNTALRGTVAAGSSCADDGSSENMEQSNSLYECCVTKSGITGSKIDKGTYCDGEVSSYPCQ